MTGMNSMSLTDGYLSERQCGEPVCAGYRWREDSGVSVTQQTHATALEALATQQTTLTSSVGDLTASVQNTAKTVADVNGTVSSLWSMKVETVIA